MSERSRWIAPIALGGAGVAYVNSCLRPRGDNAELLPEDDLLPDAEIVETHETVLQAPVADVWPWLVQMGAGRGGFYSFDVLSLSHQGVVLFRLRMTRAVATILVMVDGARVSLLRACGP